MNSASRNEITLLLHEWGSGDRAAFDKLTDEAAEVLAISTSTVGREWRSAKTRLSQAMTKGNS